MAISDSVVVVSLNCDKICMARLLCLHRCTVRVYYHILVYVYKSELLSSRILQYGFITVTCELLHLTICIAAMVLLLVLIHVHYYVAIADVQQIPSFPYG